MDDFLITLIVVGAISFSTAAGPLSSDIRRYQSQPHSQLQNRSRHGSFRRAALRSSRRNRASSFSRARCSSSVKCNSRP